MHFNIFSFCLVLIVSSAFFTTNGQAQQKIKLSPVTNTIKPRIAYVDLVRLHNESRCLKAGRDTTAGQWLTAQSEYERNSTNQKSQQGRDSLLTAWKKLQLSLQKREASRSHAMEKKITEAVREVAREGGFTEVKTTKIASASAQETDITDLVLLKLN